MPCDRDFARRQIRRLAGLEFFPDVTEAANELVEALLTAPDEVRARDFVGAWLHANTAAPKPADIYANFKLPGAIAEFKPSMEPACPKCGDTGFVIIERQGRSGADKCDCRKNGAA